MRPAVGATDGPGMTSPPPLPWAPGTATGIGSVPGTDPSEAVRVVLGELAALPFLPELPGRGAVADLAGRAREAHGRLDRAEHTDPVDHRVGDAHRSAVSSGT